MKETGMFFEKFILFCMVGDFAEATTVPSFFLLGETAVSLYAANLFICTNLSSTYYGPGGDMFVRERRQMEY